MSMKLGFQITRLKKFTNEWNEVVYRCLIRHTCGALRRHAAFAPQLCRGMPVSETVGVCDRMAELGRSPPAGVAHDPYRRSFTQPCGGVRPGADSRGIPIAVIAERQSGRLCLSGLVFRLILYIRRTKELVQMFYQQLSLTSVSDVMRRPALLYDTLVSSKFS